MTSRLDRLFVLLEAGMGPATRRAAARQLGEIQKTHPEELHRLLARLMKHLRSPAWDTRIAASQAVEAILSNVPEWHPSPLAVVKEEQIEDDVTRLRCETFDIERVLQYGAHLMGSEGREYDFDEEVVPAADMKERLAKQRQQLNARLGLDVASKWGVDLTSVYSNEDLCPVKTQPVKTEEPRRPVQEVVEACGSKCLSSREMNVAKRKMRQALCKQKSRESDEPAAPPAEPALKKIKLEPADEFTFESGAPVPDCSGAWGESGRWPLEAWCAALQAQLFGAAWEARHGAASALRELLRARVAASAGQRAGMTPTQMEDAHQEWLEDMALRLLCVLALDKFGDFVSDQVVAPVRETCAQTLGVALAQLRPERVRAVAALLAALAAQPQWEARHGALLGFKYLLAARQEVACSGGALEHLMAGLADGAEDVSAVAAGALVPAAAALAAARPHRLPSLVARYVPPHPDPPLPHLMAGLADGAEDVSAVAAGALVPAAAALAAARPHRLPSLVARYVPPHPDPPLPHLMAGLADGAEDVSAVAAGALVPAAAALAAARPHRLPSLVARYVPPHPDPPLPHLMAGLADGAEDVSAVAAGALVPAAAALAAARPHRLPSLVARYVPPHPDPPLPHLMAGLADGAEDVSAVAAGALVPAAAALAAARPHRLPSLVARYVPPHPDPPLPHLMTGLADGAEDVSAVAAGALVPAAAALAAARPHRLPSLVARYVPPHPDPPLPHLMAGLADGAEDVSAVAAGALVPAAAALAAARPHRLPSLVARYVPPHPDPPLPHLMAGLADGAEDVSAVAAGALVPAAAALAAARPHRLPSLVARYVPPHPDPPLPHLMAGLADGAEDVSAVAAGALVPAAAALAAARPHRLPSLVARYVPPHPDPPLPHLMAGLADGAEDVSAVAAGALVPAAAALAAARPHRLPSLVARYVPPHPDPPLPHLMAGLADGAEDVSAVAAGALVPAAAALAAARPHRLPSLVARLWQLLHDQDDLAAPANSYMALLASLMALPQAAKLLHPIDLSDVLPRLWPYLDHSTSSVRKATLQTLRTLTRPLVTSHSPTENGGTNGSPEQKPSDVKIEDSQIKTEESQSGENARKREESQSESDNKCSESETKAVKSEEMCSEMNGVDDRYLNWTPELLQEAMRHIYQRVLFEHVHEIQDIAIQVWENLLRHAPLSTILVSACPMLATWLCLAMQPARLCVDPGLLVHPPPKERRLRTQSQSSLEGEAPAELRPGHKWFVGGGEAQPGERNVTRARCLAAQILGYLSCYLVQPAPGIEYKPEDESPIDCYVKVMVVYLRSGSALQRLVASLVISSWARNTLKYKLYPPHLQPSTNGHTQHKEEVNDISKLAPPLLVSTIHTALNQALYYDEVALTCNRLLQEARDLHAMMKHYKLPVDGEEFHNILRLEQVAHLTTITQPMVASMKSKRVAQTLEERRRNLESAVNQCSTEQNTYNVSVQAALAGACANLHCLPEKLNPVVRPLMESIKKEFSEELQASSADTLAVLTAQLAGREPCPNNKVLVNLKAFLRCDPEYTPRISLENTEENGESASDSGTEGNSEADTSREPALDKLNGILTLWEQQRSAARSAPRRGRPPSHAAPPLCLDQLLANEDEPRKLLRIQRRGATLALTSLTRYFGDELPEKLPKLWEFITEPFAKVMTDSELESVEAEAGEELISRLQVVEAVAGALGAAGWARVAAGAPACAALARCRYTAVRHMAARALAACARRDLHTGMRTVIDQLLPALSDVRCARRRCGAAEALARVVDALQLQLVPYIVLLVVPLLGRMSDQCSAVRVMSTRCFAALIQLMPLDGGGAAAEPPGLPPELRERRRKDSQFLHQLFNPKSIQDYKIPVPVSAQLRSYQQAGVNWLRFLYSYKLHGVLCDDMGLGKTLQSIVVVAGSHWERTRDRAPALPSLVVCPPTLTGHWVFEVNKFIPTEFLKPLQYVGPPVERERLRSQVKYYNLIVASYDIVRKDIDFFSKIKWNYCILDEGHVIKNGKTKAFKAIKQLIANHRLILSGTPIQNNVLELWSLFDFLMPGLLGSERQFTARYSRPILAARDARATTQQLQAGALACEALHRQVLPFLLRRVKEDVLKELPPKITQDYYCELSPLQRRLYEQLSKDHMPQDLRPTSSHTHVFQALHYLQNVCNHPKLVLTGEHPDTARVLQQLAAAGSSLDDIHHSAKLPALKQLLLDCGIGTTASDTDEVVVSQHRALVFCQLKKMLDIVEKDLLQKHLPAVTYLRLDGSVPPPQRHAIVTRFNSDVSIDLLLLTTQVGGLGLNLTGADTVIFVEHDWNPMKDVQAMDRAHRIGQKKVVNVYRLITRDTLEEKIMGLQKFKLQTANTVISSENAAMETMGTEQLLDLFQLSGAAGGAQPGGSDGSARAVLDALPDLWDDKQYEDEYDMSNFIKGLNKMSA